MKKALFINEADLCARFVEALPEDWTAYAETGGFDLLLVRADGVQIGIEAKMALNAKVILQSLDHGGWYSGGNGPDFRAALVPYGTAGADLASLARYLGIQVISMHDDATLAAQDKWLGYRRHPGDRRFTPALPSPADYIAEKWVDHMPVTRIELPEYVPDHGGGHSAPMQLSAWKIKAIKIAVLLEVNGFVTWRDFKELMIDKRLWVTMGWIRPSEVTGQYIEGGRPIGLRKQHPVNFEQVKADLDKWRPKTEGLPL